MARVKEALLNMLDTKKFLPLPKVQEEGKKYFQSRYTERK